MLFSPPPPLSERLAAAGGRLGARDLFVKRVVAVGGDSVRLLPGGIVSVNGEPRARPPRACPLEGNDDEASLAESARRSAMMTLSTEGRLVPDGSLFVLGDCAERSVDSRVWGPLESNYVVGEPVLRLWPPDRMGLINQ